MLSDEDKQWIRQIFAMQREEDRQWFLKMREEDRQWFLKMREEDRLAAAKQRVEDKDWVLEQIENVETKLLTPFHNWASPIEARHRTHSAALHALDLEVEALQDRIKKIEERLDIR